MFFSFKNPLTKELNNEVLQRHFLELFCSFSILKHVFECIFQCHQNTFSFCSCPFLIPTEKLHSPFFLGTFPSPCWVIWCILKMCFMLFALHFLFRSFMSSFGKEPTKTVQRGGGLEKKLHGWKIRQHS